MKKFLGIITAAFFSAVCGMLGGSAVITLFPANADQSERIVPTAGIYTGPQYAQKIGDMARSISTANKGSSAPANVSGSSVDGLEWLDDATTPWVKKRYINGGWVEEAAYDPTGTPSYIGLLGGGGIGTVASASITDLSSVKQSNVSITGTTTITSFGSSAPTGAIKIIRFAAALTLTYSSALPVPCGYNLVTAADDRAIVTHLGSGNWEITSYQRANGVPVDCSSIGKIEFANVASVPANHVAGYGQPLTRTSYPAYTAAVTRAQNGTRSSGSEIITSVSNTKGLGAGMPVEGTGIQAGCYIASVTSTSITLNSSTCTTSSGTSTVTVFLTGYGSGGSSSTVGVADCRGRALAGRDRDDLGSFAGLLTTTYFGADGKVFNVQGGAESRTLTLAQIPTGITSSGNNTINVTSSGNPYFRSNGVVVTFNTSPGGGADGVQPGTGSLAAVSSSSGSNSIAVTSNNTSGSAHATASPALIAECLIRVTP